MLRAKQEGYNVKGYFVWSFLDGFEWSEGLQIRMGLVYVDYQDNNSRTPKNSLKWYSQFISEYSPLIIKTDEL